MSLQGTLDAFSLDEIADLVERGERTGALSARDGRFAGTIWFRGGGLSAAEAGGSTGPCGSPEDLQVRLVDVCFELFALRQGFFEFVPGEEPPWAAPDVVSLAAVAERVAAVAGDDWESVLATVPSFDHRPTLAGDLEGDSVTLTLDRLAWRLMAQMDGRRDVREIGRQLGVSALEVARTLRRLVDAGAVELLAPEEADVVPLPRPAGPAGREAVVGYQPPRPVQDLEDAVGLHPSADGVLDPAELAAARRALERAALGLGDGDDDGEPPYYDQAGRLLDAALVGGPDAEVDVRRFGHATVGGALDEAYATTDAGALGATIDIAGEAEAHEATGGDDAEEDGPGGDGDVPVAARPGESAGDRASLLRMFSSLNNKR